MSTMKKFEKKLSTLSNNRHPNLDSIKKLTITQSTITKLTL